MISEEGTFRFEFFTKKTFIFIIAFELSQTSLNNFLIYKSIFIFSFLIKKRLAQVFSLNIRGETWQKSFKTSNLLRKLIYWFLYKKNAPATSWKYTKNIIQITNLVLFLLKPAGNYMFKINNRNTSIDIAVILVSLLLTLNIFHTLFWYFYC